jgi:hypothetical protein
VTINSLVNVYWPMLRLPLLLFVVALAAWWVVRRRNTRQSP